MIRALVLAVLLPLPALAQQGLPDWLHTSINDFAGLLSEDTTRILDQALIALHDDTGVEGTVVTLDSRAGYGDATLEDFATRLFNHWGVGDRDRNDGFMVLILRDDRETRIELGAGYPTRADQVAAQIISRDMLPAFRQGRMSDGIQAGTLAVIDQIARPQAEGRTPTAARRWQDWLPIGIFGTFFAAFALHLGRNALRRHGRCACPQCGSRKLQRHDDYATQTLPGGSPTRMVQTRHTCPDCGWHDQGTMIPVPVSGFSRSEGPRSSGGRSGGFGGGHSGGGGASGRW